MNLLMLALVYFYKYHNSNLKLVFFSLIVLFPSMVFSADNPQFDSVFTSDVQGAMEVQAKAAITKKPVRLIVRLSENAVNGTRNSRLSGVAQLNSPAAKVKSARKKFKTRLKNMGIHQIKDIDELPLLVVEATADQVDQIVVNGEVAEVFEDTLVPPTLMDTTPLIDANDLHNLANRGEGTTIAILDTGVQINHPFLNGRVIEEACFSTTSSASNSSSLCPGGVANSTSAGSAAPCTGISGCDHGTHVAGIAAGRATSTSTFNGVAPDANIFAIKIFSKITDSAGNTPCADSGRASPCILTYTSDQIKALTLVALRRSARNIVAVNMSLGGGKFTSSCSTDVRALLINELRNVGVATVIASGNDGYRNAVGAPGCIPNAITVGSTTKTDAVSSFSNISSLVDLLAPGSSINSSITGSSFGFKSGTSMATPQVSGAFAILRSAVPNASVNQIESALKNTGVSITIPNTNPVMSKPRIDLDGALAALTLIPASGQLYRLLSNGQISAFGGSACSTSSCNSWTMLDNNPKTLQLASGNGTLYQLQNDGVIKRFTGKACANGCVGWQQLDLNSIYQFKADGSVYKYTGTPCSGSTCTGWQMLSKDPLSKKILASGSNLYQLHSNGNVWKYSGAPCVGNTCSGWQQLGNNALTVDIVADGTNLYQLDTKGGVWKYDGIACEGNNCAGWQKLDTNVNINQIAAGGNNLYQRRTNGEIWRFAGSSCSSSDCSIWDRLDNNPLTVEISASASGLYQRHSNGNVWRSTGGACSGNSCPGWEPIGNNAATKSLSSARQ
jgi:hypothetical protein